jgi:hypothetical protein
MMRISQLISQLSEKIHYACERSSVDQADVGICAFQQYKMVTRTVVGSSSGCPFEEIGYPFSTYGSWYNTVIVRIRSGVQCINSSTPIRCCNEMLSFPA